MTSYMIGTQSLSCLEQRTRAIDAFADDDDEM